MTTIEDDVVQGTRDVAKALRLLDLDAMTPEQRRSIQEQTAEHLESLAQGIELMRKTITALETFLAAIEPGVPTKQ